jgi:hypothetical protein
MQHRVLDLRPGMPGEVSPAQADFGRLASLEIDRELAEAASHAARYPDGDLAQSSSKMLRVQLMMKIFQPMEKKHVSGPSPFAASWSLRRLHIGVGGKLEELSFCGFSERPRHPGIQKPNDGLQHAIRRETIAPVDPEDPLAKAQHHRLVRMSQDLFDVPETERLQPFGKTVFK